MNLAKCVIYIKQQDKDQKYLSIKLEHITFQDKI